MLSSHLCNFFGYFMFFTSLQLQWLYMFSFAIEFCLRAGSHLNAKYATCSNLRQTVQEPRPLPRRRPLHPRSKIESYSAVLRVGRALVWFLHCLFWDELFEKVNDGPLFYYLRIIVSCMCQNNACFISLLESFCRCHFSCVL